MSLTGKTAVTGRPGPCRSRSGGSAAVRHDRRYPAVPRAPAAGPPRAESAGGLISPRACVEGVALRTSGSTAMCRSGRWRSISSRAVRTVASGHTRSTLPVRCRTTNVDPSSGFSTAAVGPGAGSRVSVGAQARGRRRAPGRKLEQGGGRQAGAGVAAAWFTPRCPRTPSPATLQRRAGVNL